MEYYQSLQDLAEELIPQENYKRLGFVSSEDLPYYYSACDVIVLPYRYTLSASGPMAIAIAYGTPFLASEYFPDFQECIFEMSAEGCKKGLEQFYTNQDIYTDYIARLLQERQYSVCMKKSVGIYQNV